MKKINVIISVLSVLGISCMLFSSENPTSSSRPLKVIDGLPLDARPLKPLTSSQRVKQVLSLQKRSWQQGIVDKYAEKMPGFAFFSRDNRLDIIGAFLVYDAGWQVNSSLPATDDFLKDLLQWKADDQKLKQDVTQADRKATFDEMSKLWETRLSLSDKDGDMTYELVVPEDVRYFYSINSKTRSHIGSISNQETGELIDWYVRRCSPHSKIYED